MTEITNITATELRGRLFEILNQVYLHNRVYGIIRHRKLQATQLALDILHRIEKPTITPQEEANAEAFGID